MYWRCSSRLMSTLRKYSRHIPRSGRLVDDVRHLLWWDGETHEFLQNFMQSAKQNFVQRILSSTGITLRSEGNAIHGGSGFHKSGRRFMLNRSAIVLLFSFLGAGVLAANCQAP